MSKWNFVNILLEACGLTFMTVPDDILNRNDAYTFIGAAHIVSLQLTCPMKAIQGHRPGDFAMCFVHAQVD